MHDFSPQELAIGHNSKLPPTINNKVPAATSQPLSKAVSDNLDTIHKAKVFIASENSERIRKALSYNIRGSANIKYIRKTQSTTNKWTAGGRIDQQKH